MPVHFSIDKAAKLVRTHLSGPLTQINLEGYMADVIQHPDYQPGLRALVQCVDLQLGPLSAKAIRHLAEFSRLAERDLASSRVAVVANQPAVFGLARMYELMRDPPYDVHVFRDLDAAEAWLFRDG